MAYQKQEWVNGDTSKPVNATRLNHIEDGINTAQSTADGKADKSAIPDVSGFAKKSDIPAAPDLSGYAKKTDVPSIAGLAKQSDLTALAARVTALETPAEG